MNSAMLAPQGETQTYTKLMQQMTVMSHLQSDNMAIPINSFTSFLTAGINSKVCCITAIKIQKKNDLIYITQQNLTEKNLYQHQATGPIASSNEQHLSNWGQYFVPSEQEHEEDDEANLIPATNKKIILDCTGNAFVFYACAFVILHLLT